MSATATTNVEVLYFEGCPSWQRAFAVTQRLVGELGIRAEVEARLVADAIDAQRLHFLGSPTVRVNGRDIEPSSDARTDYALACRIYRTNAGLAELPDERWLRAALEAAQ